MGICIDGMNVRSDVSKGYAKEMNRGQLSLRLILTSRLASVLTQKCKIFPLFMRVSMLGKEYFGTKDCSMHI